MGSDPRYGVQLCMPLDMAHLRKVLAEVGYVLVQPKLKGMHLHWNGHVLRSAQFGRLPALKHIAADLDQIFPDFPVEGEAYLHGLEESEIIGRCHRQAPDSETASIQMHVFDWSGPAAAVTSTRARMRMLETTTPTGSIQIIKAEECFNAREVRQALATAERQGFEGIVVRDPQALWQAGKHPGVMKWKPRHYDQYAVAEVIEGSPGKAGALALRDPEGSTFKVGGLCLSKSQRQKLWERRDEALGKMAWVSYCGADEDGHHAARVEKILDLPWLAERPAMRFQIDLED